MFTNNYVPQMIGECFDRGKILWIDFVFNNQLQFLFAYKSGKKFPRRHDFKSSRMVTGMIFLFRCMAR